MSEQELLRQIVEVLENALEKSESFAYRLRTWLKQRKDDLREKGAPTIDDDFERYGNFYRPKQKPNPAQMSDVERLKHKINERKSS